MFNFSEAKVKCDYATEKKIFNRTSQSQTKKARNPYSRRRFKQNKKKVRPNVHFRSIARFNRKMVVFILWLR